MDGNHETPRPEPVVRVRFGPRPNQEMPLEWAEHIFMAMCATETNRKRFGDFLREAMLAGLPPIDQNGSHP